MLPRSGLRSSEQLPLAVSFRVIPLNQTLRNVTYIVHTISSLKARQAQGQGERILPLLYGRLPNGVATRGWEN